MWKQLGIALAAFLAYGLRDMLVNHWYFAQPQRGDYDKKPNFIEREIETVYYEPGKLGEVLPQVIFIFHLCILLCGADGMATCSGWTASSSFA